MDLRPMFLIYFIVLSSCFIFPFFYIVSENEKELKILFKVATILIILGCIGLIKTMYF